jgi:hypothetical protein
MRAGTTNRSLPLARNLQRTRKPQAMPRPRPPPHLPNLTSVLPSGPIASGPAHRRRRPGSPRPLCIGELWNVPSVSSYVCFPTVNAHKAHQFFLTISPRLRRFGSPAPLTRFHSRRLIPDCATAERVFVSGFRGRLSITPRTSTTRGVATRRYAQNALSRSSDPNRRPLIWFPNRPLVLTACRNISGWYTPRLLGGPGLAATVRYVTLFGSLSSIFESLTLFSPDASVMAGLSQEGIPIIRGRGDAVTSP